MQPVPQGPNGELASASLNAFESAIDLLEGAVAKIRSTWQDLTLGIANMVAAIRRKLDDSWFGDVIEWFTDSVSDALKEIERIMREAEQKVTEMLSELDASLNGALPVRDLFTVGLAWSEKVNAKLSKITPDIKQSGGIDSWEGPANRTYRIREQEQEQATSQVSEGAQELGLWLTEVGVSNVQFVEKVFVQAGQVIDKLVEIASSVAVVATTGDPLSGQEAVNDLGSTMGRFAANLIEYIASLGTRLAEVVHDVNKVTAAHNDYRAFPGGHWPPVLQPAPRTPRRATS